MTKDTQSMKDGTAGQRKAAARAERQRRKRQQNIFFIGVIVVVVLTIILLIVWANRPVEIATIPVTVNQYADLPASVTADGVYRLGNPDAPVVMETFSSFTCGHCADLHEEIVPLLIDQVREGQLSLVIYPLANSEMSNWASRAAICAGQQNPIKFWEVTEIGFAWYGEIYGQRHMETAAAEIGLVTDQFSPCMTSSETSEILQGVRDEASERGVSGTPAIFFNGERPECGDPESNCEGNLPLPIIEQNIQYHLANPSEAEVEEDTGETEEMDETEEAGEGGATDAPDEDAEAEAADEAAEGDAGGSADEAEVEESSSEE